MADASRTEKTICLAVSPSLKAYGIPGRARLFEVVQRVKEVNNGRLRDAIRNRTAVYKDGKASLAAPSYDATALAADPSLEVSYLVAPPRMAYYEKVSRQIYGIYLKYIAPEDIVVYSIDEVVPMRQWQFLYSDQIDFLADHLFFYATFRMRNHFRLLSHVLPPYYPEEAENWV